MNGEVDREWEAWATDWRADDPAVQALAGAELRRKVRRHTSGLAAFVVFEVLFTVGTLGYFAREAYRSRTATDLALVRALAVIFAVFWGFALDNRRDTWRPASESIRDFLDLSKRRAERQLRTIRYLPHLVVFELLLVVPVLVFKLTPIPTLGRAFRRHSGRGSRSLAAAWWPSWPL